MTPESPTTVSVVIVNWNGADVLPACLRSLDTQTGIELAEVIVVDNASTDTSAEYLSSSTPDLDFKLDVFFNEENRGFGAANNQGAQAATGEVLVLLNPDTELPDAGVLATLAGELEDPTVGLVGPHLLNTDATTQGSCAAFPSVLHSIAKASGLHKLLPTSLLRRIAPEEWSQDSSADTDWLRGACLAFRRDDYLELGGFSEATFMYGEDLEIAYEIRQTGARVRFCHEASVVHHDDHSANQRWSTPERMQKVAAGDLMFLRRHYSAPRRAAIRSIDALGYLGRWAIHSIRRDERAATYGALARVYLRGAR